MNKLDLDYIKLLEDILEKGVKKSDRTGTGTLSVFNRQIRHNMSDGFPILTSKKIPFNLVVSELLWFLQGRTDLRYLLEHNNHIWVSDAYKAYVNNRELPIKYLFNKAGKETCTDDDFYRHYSRDEFIERIKIDDELSGAFGNLGPIYGKQWRSVVKMGWHKEGETGIHYIDQISNLVNDIKTNPDSRRLIVNAWNPSALESMTLPPCHYAFQCYTRLLTWEEQVQWVLRNTEVELENVYIVEEIAKETTPKRALSLMSNCRSTDVPLGLPFNIASYGLLLSILGKICNMVPDELIINMGDTHIYLDQIEGAKEQIGQDLSIDDRMDWWFNNNKPNRDVCDYVDMLPVKSKQIYFDEANVPKRTREPFFLPRLVHGKSNEFWKSFDVSMFGHLDPKDFKLENYKHHTAIKFPLSN